MLNLEDLDGFVRHLETREQVEDLYFDIFDYNEEEIEQCKMTTEEMRYNLINFYTIHYPYVIVLRPNVYQIVDCDLKVDYGE